MAIHSIDSIARHLPSQTIDIYRPHVKVTQRFPQERKRDRISIRHITLGRIIPDGTIAEDVLFPLGKPAVLSEPALGSSRRGSHLEERPRLSEMHRRNPDRYIPDGYGEHKDTFDEEEPSPSLSSGHTSHTEHTKRNQRSDNVAIRQPLSSVL